MGKSEITLTYKKNKGLLHLNNLMDLDAPIELIEMAKNNAKEINNINFNNKSKCWLCIFVPIGVAIIFLFKFLFSQPFKYLGYALGVPLFFIYSCHKTSVSKTRKEKIIKKVIEIKKKTKGVITAIPNYKVFKIIIRQGPTMFLLV
jgi:hypothetical protein